LRPSPAIYIHTYKDKGHIADAFNEYFSSVAQTIIDDTNKDNN
jgi:hypothetical protein